MAAPAHPGLAADDNTQKASALLSASGSVVFFNEPSAQDQRDARRLHLNRSLCNFSPIGGRAWEMATKNRQEHSSEIRNLIEALNEDLAREYQAIIAYTVYSNVLKGAKWMNIAAELKLHAAEELQHALIIADQIDYLGGMPTAVPKPVKLSEKPEEMIQFDLDNETETILNYRQRVQQAEALRHYALAEKIRKIIGQEQEHQHDLATALGVDVPNVLPQGA
jgi:bacterioferritin